MRGEGAIVKEEDFETGLESATRIYFDSAALFGGWPELTGAQRLVLEKLRSRGATLCLPVLVRWELAAVMKGLRRDAFTDYRNAVAALRKHVHVADIEIDVSSADTNYALQEDEVVRANFVEVPLPDVPLEAILRDSAAHIPPFKVREKAGQSADRSFRDSMIQMSILHDFSSSAAAFGLVVSPDTSFHDTVALEYLQNARIQVVRTSGEVFSWLMTHVRNWLSERQRVEQQAVEAWIHERRADLQDFVRQNLKVPTHIAVPGILKGVDDIRIEKITSVVAGLSGLQDEHSVVIIDLSLDVDILEQPAIWQPPQSVGIGEAIQPPKITWRQLADDWRERTVHAQASVSARYRIHDATIDDLVFDTVRYGDPSLENLLADRMYESMFVKSDLDGKESSTAGEK